MRNEIAILQKALADAVSQNDQLNDKVAALSEDRDRLRDEVSEQADTIRELTSLMGLAHYPDGTNKQI